MANREDYNQQDIEFNNYDDYRENDNRNNYRGGNARDDYRGGNDRRSYYPEDDDDSNYYPRQRRQSQRQDYYQQDQSGRDSGYRDGYRDGFRDNNQSRNYSSEPRNNNMDNNTPKPNFRKRHPVLMNLIYACAATVVFFYIALWFLDFWTFHGQERAVPDVKGQSFSMAEGNIERAGLRCVVTDSIYDTYARPGTVVEQSPIPSARIKKGGTVYLTLVAYSPKMVTFPDFYDVSERQARSMLMGLGITQIMTVKVPSEYTGLVLGAKFNGVSLRPGAKVPITAIITLEVGGEIEQPDIDNELVDSVAIDEVIDALNID